MKMEEWRAIFSRVKTGYLVTSHTHTIKLVFLVLSAKRGPEKEQILLFTR